MARPEGFAPSLDDVEIPGNDGPVVAVAPSLGGTAGRVVGRVGSRVAQGPVTWAASEAAGAASTAGLVAREVAGDLPGDVAAVARGMASSVPRDVAAGTARAAMTATYAAMPVVRAVADRVFAGVPSTGQAAAAGANWVAGWAARAASGEWLRHGWGRFAGRWRMQAEKW